MSEPLSLVNTGKALKAETPWVLIAVLLHAVVICIASVIYYVHASAADDTLPTEIQIASMKPAIEEIRPPEVVDEVPKMGDIDLTPDPFTAFTPNVTDDNHGEEGDSDVSDLASALSGDSGGTAIAPHGPGFFSDRPSPHGGRKPGSPKYRGRFGPKKGPNSTGMQPVNEAVTAGLEWLRRHQDEDGKWDCDGFARHDTAGEPCTGPGSAANDVGVTGLALLAFLGDGNTVRLGPYRKVVLNGVRWLIDQQDPATGLIGAQSSSGYMYSHAIAAVALCEAYGLSEFTRLREPAQKAVNYIAQARNPYGVWRYEPKSSDGDTSITGWMVQALLSAKEFDLAVDDAALKTALVFFDGLTDPATGAAGYTKMGEGSSRPVGKVAKFPSAKTEAMTAVVLLCRHLMQEDPGKSRTMELAAQTILKKPPTWNEADGSIDMYYWYYACYALYQAGGKVWDEWSKKFNAAALKHQKKEGNPKGSWDPADAWGDDGGRVYSTAIMVLCLEACYRYGQVSFAR